jgi:hypothetical protein
MTVGFAAGGRPIIYVRDANLSTSGRVVLTGIEYDAVDVTAFADSAHRNLLGQPSVTFRFDGLFDGSGLASHNALVDLLGTRRAVTVWMEGDGTGTMGIGLGSAGAEQYRPGGNVGEYVSVGANIIQDGTWDKPVSLGSSTLVALGASATFAGPDVDGLGTTTGGGAFFIHCFVMATGTLSFRLQDSAAGGGAGYTNVTGATATFAGVGGGGTTFGTILTFTTLLQRYRRINITTIVGGGTGTVTFQASVGTR